MKQIFLLVLLLAPLKVLIAQGHAKPNEIFAELGNNSVAVAVNYQRQLNGKTGFAIRTGFGAIGFRPFKPLVPAAIVYRFGLKDSASFLDVNLGLTWTSLNTDLYASLKFDPANPPHNKYFLPTPGVNWVHHSKKFFVYRLGISIICTRVVALPLVGFAVGKRF